MAYKFNPPSNSTGRKQSNDQSNPKYRIYTIFKSNIVLDEISIPQSTGDQNKEQTQKLEDAASIEYPLIRINDYILSRDEIDTFEIDCTNFIPIISLSCTFFSDTFMSREMPKDGDIISIAIRNRNDILNMIRNDYVITSVIADDKYTTIKGATRVTLFGELFIPWLKSAKNDFSFLGTSLEALKDMAKKFGYGFATNDDNTKDKQIWMCANSTLEQYIKQVADRSWRDEKSFYKVWFDIYYNLNFINLNKQLLSSEEEIDPAALMSNIDTTYQYGLNSDEANAIKTPKVFSNYIGYRTTSFFINSWRPINNSSAITFQIGTKMYCEMFEHNVNLYKDPNSQKYWTLQLEPSYDDQKTNNHILLRGRTTFDSSTNSKDLARANYSYVDIYAKYPWLGIQYTISNPDDTNDKWTGNQHRNYLRARVQNLINNKELDKLNVEITVNGTNLNIIKGDKLPIALIKTDIVNNMLINKDAENRDMLDMFYSGYYLVKGFSINWNGDDKGSVMSNFTQTFILTRNMWPPPIPTQAIKLKEGNANL